MRAAFCRIPAGDAHVDHVGALGAFHHEAALQRVQGGQRAVGRRGAQPSPNAAIKPRSSDGRPANSGSRSSASRLDHAAQNAVGGQHPNLALDLQHGDIAHLIGRTELVADRAQIRRINENLRRRGVSMRHDEDERPP